MIVFLVIMHCIISILQVTFPMTTQMIISCLCFGFTFCSVLYFVCQSPSSSFAQFFILLIKHRPELFLQSVYKCIVFEDFNVYHKDWLSCSGEVYRQDELCYNFVSLRASLRLLTSLHGSLTIMSTFVLFWT